MQAGNVLSPWGLLLSVQFMVPSKEAGARVLAHGKRGEGRKAKERDYEWHKFSLP